MCGVICRAIEDYIRTCGAVTYNSLTMPVDYIPSLSAWIKISRCESICLFFGDPYENRTHVSAVKGRCLSRLTNGPLWWL